MYSKLGKKDFQFIKDNYAKMTGVEIAKFLGVTRQAINSYANRNGLKKEFRKHNTGLAWTEAEILYLTQNYQTSAVSDLMKRLNRTKWAICSKKLELKKAGRIG